MAKPIVLAFEGSESSFDHAKLDRARLYGARKCIPLDQKGPTYSKSAYLVLANPSTISTRAQKA